MTLQFDDVTYDRFNVQHARLQSPQCTSGWLVLGYVDKTKLGLQALGTGGSQELVKHLRDNEVQYVLLRVKHVGASFTKLRNVFIVWTGPGVSSVVKGQKRSHAGEVKALLQVRQSSCRVGMESSRSASLYMWSWRRSGGQTFRTTQFLTCVRPMRVLM